MVKQQTQKKRRATKTTVHPTNVWDAVINFTNIAYDLVNSGNIWGLLLLLVFGIVGFTIFNLPAEDVSPLVKLLIQPFFKTGTPYYVLLAGLGFSVYANVLQRVTYKKEIKRLTDIRKTLVHGKETGALKELENHTSSKTIL